MPSQSILSDYFSSPRVINGSAKKQSGKEVVLLSSDEDDAPVASTSKRPAPVLTASHDARLTPNRVERFRFSPSKRDEPSSSLPEATKDWGVRSLPADPALHASFVARLGPKGKRKRKERDDDQHDDAPPNKAATLTDKFAKKPAKSAKAKGKENEQVVKHTPLEEQIIRLKAEHPGVMLLFQVGYKYKFYGEDAVNAARVLSIACFWERTFQSAMVPEVRVDVHVRRLLSAGYKVGLVKQMETAALKKAGDNKSGPFVRKMTQLFTSATRVEELDLGDSPTSSTTVLCIIEQPIGGAGVDERVRISLISVQPSTAEVIYDEFEDGFMRSELETRLLHLEPGEIAIPSDLSKHTLRMIKYILGRDVDGNTGRLEELIGKHPMSYESALAHIDEYLSQSAAPIETGASGEIDLDTPTNADIAARLQLVQGLPRLNVIAIAAFLDYLEQYGLDPVFKRGSMHHFQDRISMELNANTLQNLEIFVNQTDFTERGSLLWIIDHTKTRMGRRLLRKWLARPLTDINKLNARLDSVDELLSSKSYIVGKLRGLLIGLPDLERGLCRIHYKKATVQELVRVLQAFVRVGEQFSAGEGDNAFKSPDLTATLASLHPAKVAAEAKLDMLNATAAKEGRLAEIFADPETYPSIQDCRDVRDPPSLVGLLFHSAQTLDAVIWELGEELEAAKKLLRKPNLEYITVALEEYLVEVRLAEAKKIVPADWVRVNSTKAVYRYRSPRMVALLEERNQCQERLDAEAQIAFLNFLTRVSEDSAAYREAISRISNLDCFFSFVDVASNPGYCRPPFVETSSIWARGLRHPMIEQLRDDPYVPNEVQFSDTGLRQMCLSGANFGGKSSLARSVALAVVMAQLGSYVAADSFTAGLVDAVYTRMGASDDLQRGRSTFMVELSETSTILKTATSRSLIIFDELGRGTSTHDGLAVAGAVLEHVVHKVNPLCIFISHWPFLGRGIADSCKRFHMSFYEENRISGIPDVVFLRKLAPGPASSSHGLNVARMALLPEDVLSKARQKADEFKEATESRTIYRRAVKLFDLLQTSDMSGAVEQAKVLAEGGVVN